MPTSEDPEPSENPGQEKPARSARQDSDHAAPEEVLSVEISLRKQAEAKVERVEQRFQLMIAAADDYGFIMLDSEGRITHWNPGARQLFGWREDEIIGKHFRVLFPKEAQEAGDPERELNSVSEKGAADDDRWHAKKDGTQFWTHGVTTALEDGDTCGFAKIVRDLTVQKRQADELAEKSRQLAAANQQKDQFLAVLAHELRNPLAPIRTATDLICGESEPSSEVRHACSILQRQVEVLVRLVDDLVDASRITSGKIQLQKKEMDLRQVANQAVDTACTLIDQHGHELSVSLPERPVSLRADPVRIEQVITNLLTNAAKYTPDGGRLWLSVDQEDDAAVVRVRDTGLGLAPESLPNLFTLFSQVARSQDHAHGGMGIGLGVVRSLVEMHGGTVAVHSDGIGRGSEFTVRLPVSSGKPRARKSAAPPHRSTSSRLRVLIVDDNADSARLMAMMLEAMNYEVQAQFSGNEGLKVAESFRPHVILLDIGMPEMDGYEFARRIREHPELRGVHLVAITGYSQNVDRQRTWEAGIDHHLVKPVERSILATLLEDIGQGS